MTVEARRCGDKSRRAALPEVARSSAASEAASGRATSGA